MSNAQDNAYDDTKLAAQTESRAGETSLDPTRQSPSASGWSRHREKAKPRRSALLVEDSAVWDRVLTDALVAEGFEVRSVKDGLAGVEQLRISPPDLLVTDFFLPNLDGGKLCQLAKRMVASKPPATIILTGGADKNLSQLPSQFADAVVAKNAPEVAVADLLAAIARLDNPDSEQPTIESVIGHERLKPRALTAKLLALKEHLDALHEGMGDAVIGVDRAERIYFVNSMATEMLGQPEEALIARKISEVLGSPEDGPIVSQIRSALTSGLGRPAPISMKVGQHQLRLSVTPLDNPAGERSALVIATDISDLLAAEEERKALLQRLHVADKMRSLGQMSAGVAHEINNPLAALIPNMEFLLQHFKNLARSTEVRLAADHSAAIQEALRDIPELLSDCSAACGQIRGVVGDMLRYAHPGGGRGEKVRVADLVDDALSLLSREVRFNAVIHRDYSETPEIVVDRSVLSQAILNVAINASQAVAMRREGPKWIRVSTVSIDGGIAIDLSNSGPAIAQSQRQEIFEPFYTTKEPGQGVGLGLSITSETVRRHGGYVEVLEQEPTTFRIWLPLDTGKALSGSRSPAPPAPASELSVLVVDDEYLVRQSLRRVLERAATVTLASGGAQALDLLQNQDYDVVLCDLLMPDMTGMEFFQHVSQHRPELAQRFVFMTGGTSDPKTREFLQRVRNPRAFKPVEPDELLNLIRRASDPAQTGQAGLSAG